MPGIRNWAGIRARWPCKSNIYSETTTKNDAKVIRVQGQQPQSCKTQFACLFNIDSMVYSKVVAHINLCKAKMNKNTSLDLC